MPRITLAHDDLAQDSRLSAYRDLKGRAGCDEDSFVCEGAFLCEKALRDNMAVRSLLLADRMVSRFEPLLAKHLSDEIPVFVLPSAAFESLAGFDFHRGVLSHLVRPPQPTQVRVLAGTRLLVLPRIDSAENLGLLLRTAAALGLDGAVLGAGPDPFSRRVVRVSMGGVWSLPLLREPDPLTILPALQDANWHLWAAALGPHTRPLATVEPPPAQQRAALVLGPEAYGLDSAWLDACDTQVCIPMHQGMDSLNVGVAGGILMHAICR